MQYGKSFNELDLSEYAEDDLLVISTRDEALEILCACVGDRVYKGHIRGAANVWSAAAACMKVGFLTDSEIEEFNEEENRNELLRAGLEYLLDEPTRWEAALECLRMGMTGEEVRKEIEGD